MTIKDNKILEISNSTTNNADAERTSLRWSGVLGSWSVRYHLSRNGYWITDQTKYRNSMLLALMLTTDTNGQAVHRALLGPFMLECQLRKKQQNKKA